METNSCHCSDQLAGYLIGEIGDEEKMILENHISTCPACQAELEDLRQAWGAIPYELDEIEVPPSLKTEVMDAIFPQEKPLPKKRWEWKYVLIAAAFLLAFGGVAYNNFMLRKQLQAMENQLAQPTQVLQAYTLKSADPAMSSAKGNAWLMQQGEIKKLVFHVQGLEKTVGEEAYQVWLIKDGKRKSAGVFHVDEGGNGVLTFDMIEQGISFSAIGITLEPDALGVQPRGKKVLGT